MKFYAPGNAEISIVEKNHFSYIPLQIQVIINESFKNHYLQAYSSNLPIFASHLSH